MTTSISTGNENEHTGNDLIFLAQKTLLPNTGCSIRVGNS
jgi:hypothetical protein